MFKPELTILNGALDGSMHKADVDPLIQPAIGSFYFWQSTQFTDSRLTAYQDLHLPVFAKRTAIDGSLWLPKFTEFQSGELKLSRQDIARVDLSRLSLQDLYLLGYQQVLVNSNDLLNDDFKNQVKVIKTYPGNTQQQSRVLINPELKLIEFQSITDVSLIKQLAEQAISFKLNQDNICQPQEAIWLEQKIVKLNLSDCLKEPQVTEIQFNYFNPWDQQALQIIDAENNIEKFVLNQKQGNLKFSPEKDSQVIYLMLDKLFSPKERGQSDSRNLGIKIEISD